MGTQEQPDDRKVVLIKSLATNNRFYALVEPERGIRNADTVERIPEDLLLGIAYPCLEDGLNDFAVIRTTFETLDIFPEDDPIREEMMGMINDARGSLLRRLNELHDCILQRRAHFLGTDYNEFKSYALDIVNRGCPRRNLDSMMKLNVFSSVAEAEGYADPNELPYYLQFVHVPLESAAQLPPREFIGKLFQEVIQSVLEDANYRNKYQFDKHVFQKFIAVMFVNYATTDPLFYGINRRDYGVSVEKEMDATPLYLAIGRELREIERQLRDGGTSELDSYDRVQSFAAPAPVTDIKPAQPAPKPAEPAEPDFDQAPPLLPDTLVNADILLGPISSLCSAAALLLKKPDAETQRFARVIMADASMLVQELKRLGIVSPFVNDPGDCSYPGMVSEPP